MTCRSIQRAFGWAHPTPGLGSLRTDLVSPQKKMCDGRIVLQRLGQGLEAATDQGWCLDFRALPSKIWSLKSRKQFTFNWDIPNLSQRRLVTWKYTPEVQKIIRNPQLHPASMFDKSPRPKMNNEMNESVASGQRNATGDVFEKLPGQMTRSRNRWISLIRNTDHSS